MWTVGPFLLLVHQVEGKGGEFLSGSCFLALPPTCLWGQITGCDLGRDE